MYRHRRCWTRVRNDPGVVGDIRTQYQPREKWSASFQSTLSLSTYLCRSIRSSYRRKDHCRSTTTISPVPRLPKSHTYIPAMPTNGAYVGTEGVISTAILTRPASKESECCMRGVVRPSKDAGWMIRRACALALYRLDPSETSKGVERGGRRGDEFRP